MPYLGGKPPQAPPPPPLTRVCANSNIVLCPLAIPNFGEKDSVTSCTPTILQLQIRDQDSLLFWVLTPFSQLGTCIKLSTTTPLIFYGVRKMWDNYKKKICFSFIRIKYKMCKVGFVIRILCFACRQIAKLANQG